MDEIEFFYDVGSWREVKLRVFSDVLTAEKAARRRAKQQGVVVELWARWGEAEQHIAYVRPNGWTDLTFIGSRYL